MSDEHVEAMNALLEDSEQVRKACAELPAPRTLGYALSDGPQGETVHWTVTFDDTVRFSLEPAPATDVLFSGDWKRMIQASRGNREGQAPDPGLEVSGDPAVIAEVGPVLELGRSIATLPVEFPEV